MRMLNICALGSSFASGPGILPLEVSAAGRSANNYPHLLANMLGAKLTDLTCAGATLLNVLDTPQRVHFWDVFPPQLDGVPEDADLVTVTGGGNDLGYSGAMLLASIRNSAFGTGEETDMVDAPVSVDELVGRLVAVIDGVKERAPAAKVCLVDYLPVFGESTKTGQGTPLSQGELEVYKAMAGQLSSAFRRAVEARPGTLLLAPGDWSSGHEVGSEEPWMEGFGLSMLTGFGAMPYHPNAAGHRAVAKQLARLVKEASLKH